jgi:phosphatidylserine/phosphatidylglycerophosphate/cardiolipin synthase-like enzyme
MGRRRNRWLVELLFFVLLLALAWWAYQWWQKQSPVALEGGLRVYFMPQQGRQAKEAIIRGLNSAQTQIEVAALELDDLELGQALKNAAARGVRVRLFTDDTYRREARLSLGSKSQDKAPSDAKPDSPKATRRCETLFALRVCYDTRKALMHHKFILLDQVGLWTGSTNLTWNAFARNNENSLYLAHPGLLKAYRQEFDALFAGKEEGLGGQYRFRVGSTDGEVFFSPAGGRFAREELVFQIGRARQEIWVAAYVFTDPKLVTALSEAKGRGVQVRMVFDARNLQDSKDEELKKVGIPVRVDSNPYTMHDKVMVIDGQIVVTGSYNFSLSAARSNNENLLILTDSALAGQYRGELMRIWEGGKPL